MRTTIRLNDQLLDRARKEAARRGTTLTALIEKGLTLALSGPPPDRREECVQVPVSAAGGGTLPGVDLADNAALLDVLEGRA